MKHQILYSGKSRYHRLKTSHYKSLKYHTTLVKHFKAVKSDFLSTSVSL